MPIPKAQKLPLPAGIEPAKIQIVMICEAFPKDMRDYFYSSSNSLYVTNMIDAFNSTGIKVKNISDILRKGSFLTVAVRQSRKGLVIPSAIIEKHSYTLEEELKLFPNTRAIVLMGDAAIKALNFISRRTYKARVVPAGSTYKIRHEKYYFGNIRVFPSYLPTGKNFLIEKSKREMVAEDIRNAFQLIR